jgi:hypothetical protein
MYNYSSTTRALITLRVSSVCGIQSFIQTPPLLFYSAVFFVFSTERKCPGLPRIAGQNVRGLTLAGNDPCGTGRISVGAGSTRRTNSGPTLPVPSRRPGK